jgi:hypothetical protein
MTSKHYIIKNKKVLEVPLMEWATWFESPEGMKERVIKQDRVGDLFVSTVFLGLDYAWDNREPILFETMIFRDTPKSEYPHEDIYQNRYHTYDEALTAHEKLVEDIKNMITSGDNYYGS